MAEELTTPGPWEAEQCEERADRPDRWRVVCKYYSDEEPGICGDHSKHWPLSERDAHAIAAVPELIGLARIIGSSYPNDPGTSDLNDEQPVSITLGTVRRAWAALAKVDR